MIESFYVVEREPGAENPSIPTWANDVPNPVGLDEASVVSVTRSDVSDVPGAFMLHDVLDREECRRFIETTEALGYLPDAAVSLPRSVRHNHNVTWVVDVRTDAIIWQRCGHLIEEENGKRALGINARFRFYRYEVGDFFSAHTDGAWPGSRVIGRRLIPNAYADRFSRLTFLVLLSDDFEGGSTHFRVNRHDPTIAAGRLEEAQMVDVRTPAGSVLCFPHGTHPLHCLHSSEPVVSGVKYIIRTDVLFGR